MNPKVVSILIKKEAEGNIPAASLMQVVES